MQLATELGTIAVSQFKDALEKLAATQGDVIPLLKETVLAWTPKAMAQELALIHICRGSARRRRRLCPSARRF